MNYLTRKEFEAVNAVVNYTPRPLTSLETVIRQLKETIEFPAPTIKCRENQQHSLEEVYKNLQMVTEDKERWEEVRDIISDHKRIDKLLEVFPYVKFEKEINGVARLNFFQLAWRQGVTFTDLQHVAEWMYSFIDLVKKLSTDKSCCIPTPQTTRSVMSRLNKRNRGSYCLELGGTERKIVDILFGDKKDVLKTILLYKFWAETAELNRRLMLMPNKLEPFYKRDGVDYLIFIDHVEDQLSGVHYLEVVLSPKVNPGGKIASNTFKFIVDKDYY